MAAVHENANAVGYASDWRKDDYEVAMAAVKNKKTPRDWETGGWTIMGTTMDPICYVSYALEYLSPRLQQDSLLHLLMHTSGRGRCNWHILRVKLKMRHFLAWLCAIRSRDEAHFDATGKAVIVGRHAIAAKRTFEEMCLFS
jgi:hypothetical protein